MSKSQCSVLSSIRANYISLSQSEKIIADYVIVNSDDMVNMSMMDIANVVGLSDATVLRFVRSIGFRGFSDFKIALAADLIRPTEAIFEELDEEDDTKTVTMKVFQAGMQLLQDTLEHLDMQAMDAALTMIQSAKRIFLYSSGTSGGIADWFLTRLIRLNYNVVMNNDAHLQIIQSSLMDKDDLVIMISRSGTADNLIRAERQAIKNGAKVLSITCNAKSVLASGATVSLTGVAKELRRDTSGSPISMLAIVDALYANLEMLDLEKTTNYQRRIWSALRSTRTSIK